MTADQPFAIRLAAEGDADAIAEVHLQSHRETYLSLVGEQNYWPGGKAERLAQWQQALAAQDAGPGIAYVAVVGGRVVGFAHAVGAQITTLYILAAWHRRGIGRALLTRLCQALAVRGITRARFAVLAVNSSAIGFYESQGARQTGVVTVEEPDLPGLSYQERLYEIPTAS
jgi:ribosomal protein S18 acetylase RimI-like enzyme